VFSTQRLLKEVNHPLGVEVARICSASRVQKLWGVCEGDEEYARPKDSAEVVFRSLLIMSVFPALTLAQHYDETDLVFRRRGLGKSPRRAIW